jgi:hypothetical protein
MSSYSEAESAIKYPSTLDTADVLLRALNNFGVLLVNGISDLTDAIVISSSTGLQATNGLVSIDNEVIAYDHIDTGGANPVLIGCDRGVDGSPAASHLAGAKVEFRSLAAMHNRLHVAILRIEAALGVLPQGLYTNLATRLDNKLPSVVSIPGDLAVWHITHDLRRPVGVQPWLQGLTTYELGTAAYTVEQEVNLTGTADITITWTDTIARHGFVVLL